MDKVYLYIYLASKTQKMVKYGHILV